MDFLRTVVVSILTWEARIVRARYEPKIIAVTGSVGKTTAKDAIFAALSGHVHVRKSEKSFNTELGVPLSILGCENGAHDPFIWLANIFRGAALIVSAQSYPQWLILEIGADRPGDIRKIAHWLRPDIVVLTGVPEIPAHVEFFKSPEDLVREKRFLAEYLKPGGKLVLNGDDMRMRELRADFRGACVTYGTESYNDYVAVNEEIVYEEGKPVGVDFRLEHKGSSIPVSVSGALGRPKVYAALVAIAVGEAVGVDIVSIARSLAAWAPTPGRMRLIEGLNGSVIIDDTYNSSPAAALSALDTLKSINGANRKIAVMGDMLELGKYSAEAHREVGVRAAQCAEMFITVGFRARVMGEAALDNGMHDEQVREYELGESARAGEELKRELREGDIVLVKGSQSMRMERTVFELMAHPEQVQELLVRQDEEWKNR